MNDRQLLRVACTAVVAVAQLALLLFWQYSHGGVPSHHFLDRADMPAISNWWGELSLPLMTWFLVGRVQQRVALQGGNARRYAPVGFLCALIYAALLALFFTLGNNPVTNALFEAMFLIALFLPIYRAEYLLGFILGLSYTIGGVLPCIVGSVIAFILMVIYRCIRGGVLWLGSLCWRAAQRS